MLWMHILLSLPFSQGVSGFLVHLLLPPYPAIRFLLSCSLKIPSEDPELPAELEDGIQSGEHKVGLTKEHGWAV